jgi:hypothetical protein
MSDVVRCLGCGARFKVGDAAKVVRSKVQCRKCGGELAAEQAKAAAAGMDHGGDDDYDFKPSAAPVATRARTSATAAASASGAAAPVVVSPTVAAKSIRKVYTDADLATEEDAESFWGRNKKLIIAITSAVVPLVLAVVIAVTYTGGKKPKRGGSTSSGGGGVAALTSNASKPPPPSPPPLLVKPAMGVWPLPVHPGPKAKGKFVDGPIQLTRTDLPPRGMAFTGRDLGQAVIVSSPNGFAGCWVDRYDLTTGKQVGSVELPHGAISRRRVTDVSPDGNLLLTVGGHYLDLWSIEGDKAVKAGDVAIVGVGADPEVSATWSGIAAPDIVLVLIETRAGDKLFSYTPRPASAPPVDLGSTHGENERKRDMRWSADAVQTFLPRFTPDRRMVAYWNDGAVQFADPATGKVVSTLPSQSSRVGSGIAFDESCTRAAVVWRDVKVGFLSIYDLKTGQTVADYPLTQADASVAPRRWLGKDHVLLDDGSVIDVTRGAPVWRYEYASRLIQAVPHPDDRFWFMAEKPKGETSLLGVKALPGPDELAGIGDAAGAFVSTRGMAVAVQMEMTGPSEATDVFVRRLQGKVEARLKQFGMAPTANATAKLQVKAVFVETGEIAEVRNAYGGSAKGRSDQVKLKTLKGSMVLNDGAGAKPMKLKDFAVGTPAHDNMPLKPGKSAEDILQDMQWDNLEGEIDDFAVPGYLPRNAKAVRSSKLEP